MMAALAAKTSTIRIGTVPFIMALRNPVLLAHAVATLDVISSGRIIIGVSSGHQYPYVEREFAACGVPFHEKAGRLNESIGLIRRLWTEDFFPLKENTIASTKSASSPNRFKTRSLFGWPPAKTNMLCGASPDSATAGLPWRIPRQSSARAAGKSTAMRESMAVEGKRSHRCRLDDEPRGLRPFRME